MTAAPAAVGVANHNGWAHFVTVALVEDGPAVLDRRRVVLVDPALPSQPYHHEAQALAGPEAQALVDRVRAAAASCARDAVETLRADLEPRFVLVAMALRRSPFGSLPDDVAEVLAHRPFTYVADAMLYLEALAAAARDAGLALLHHDKGAEYALAGAALGVDAADAEALIVEVGSALGPPWSQEHRVAAAAALAALPVPG